MKQPEPVPSPVVDPLKKSEGISAEEIERIAYLEKLEKVKDPKVAENMKYILEMGYTNFEVNMSLLQRNKNDLITAINSLCNHLVTESMFNAQ